MADEKTTFGVILGALGALYAVERLTGMFRPPSGPRLKPGELGGRDLTRKAAHNYWRAETAASGGQCAVAKRRFQRAERMQKRAEERARDGDHSVGDLRGSHRAARAEVRRCKK